MSMITDTDRSTRASPARTELISAASRSWRPLMPICSAGGRLCRVQPLCSAACGSDIRAARRDLGLIFSRRRLACRRCLRFAALYAGFLQWRFNEADLWLPFATPALVQLPLALLIGLMGQYLLKRRKEEQMTRAIRYYLPDNLVRDLTRETGRPRLR